MSTDILDDILAGSSAWQTTVREHHAHILPEAAVPFPSVAAMRAAVTGSGSHYFDRDTVRWFAARVHGSTMYGRRFFVDSIQNHGIDGPEPRQYRVSWVSGHPDRYNAPLSVEHSRDFDTLDAARAAARRLAAAYPAP